MLERTLVVIKPRFVNHFLYEKIYSNITNIYFSVGLKCLLVSRKYASEEVIKALFSGPQPEGVRAEDKNDFTPGDCVVIIFEGEDAIARVARTSGSYDFKRSTFGVINNNFAMHGPDLAVMISENPQDYERQIKIFYGNSPV